MPDRETRPAISAQAAESLAAHFAFVWVDFYDERDHPQFGELSFYPGSGLDRFDPPALDAVMGQLWRAAIGRNFTI